MHILTMASRIRGVASAELTSLFKHAPIKGMVVMSRMSFITRSRGDRISSLGERVCKLCNNDKVETEFHFVMECSKLQNLRNEL